MYVTINSLGETEEVFMPDKGWLVLPNYMINYENWHNLVYDARVAKMIELNYIACNNLMEKSEVETNYLCDDFSPNKCIRMQGKTLYISPDQCLFKPKTEPKYLDSFYITNSSGKRILEKVEELFSRLREINLKPFEN